MGLSSVVTDKTDELYEETMQSTGVILCVSV